MEEQKDYFSPSLTSLEQQESKDTYYIPKLQQTIEAGEYSSERDVEINALKKMAGKNNNAFVQGMKNLEEPISSGLFDGYLERKIKERGIELKSPTWEATKGFFEGAVTGPVRYAGYAATNTLPLIAKTATSLYAMSGAVGGVESADKYIREANKGIEAWTKEMQRLTGIDDASIVENVVGNALGSVSGSVAIGGVFGGASVATMFGVGAAQDTYARQREEGVGIGESALRGIWHGTGEAALESLQFNRIFGNLAKKSKPIAMLKDLLENAVQEGIQQANEQAANWNIDNRSLVEKLQEIGVSVVGGAIASLGGSIGGNILNRNTINEVGDLMRKTGHTEEEIKTVQANLNKIVDTDELEQAANMVANDELTTIALTYKEQAQAASEELVNQLDNVISRNELVDVPSEISGERPADMQPFYQLGEMKIDTEKSPSLGMVLYQAEQAGTPFQTLGQVLEWTKDKIGVEKAQQLSKGISSVYDQTYQQLKDMGRDDVEADRNARMRSAAAFSLAKVMDSSVEEADKALGDIKSMKAGEFKGQQQLTQYQDVAQRINEIDAEEKANGIPEYTAPTINVNGVERQTTNSEGTPIAKSEKSLRYFYDWFGDSKVVDEQGRPLVVYHGTTKRFSIFDINKTNYESDLGQGFYATNNENDVANNYEGGGADFENRLDRIAERIQEEEDISYEEAKSKALDMEFEGSIKMPLYLKMQTPFVIGGKNETVLTFEESYNEETDEYGEPTGTLIEFAYQMDNRIADLGYDYKISDKLFERAIENGGEISASEIDTILREDEEIGNLIDYEMSHGQLLSDTVGFMGYDGFIDNTVNEKFGYKRKQGQPMRGIDEDTTHYVVFNPEQLKSVDNKGTFSSSPDIYYQMEQAKPEVEFNAVTFEDPENQKAVKDAFLRNGFSEKAADDAIANLQKVVDFAKQIGSERLQEQNERNKYVEQRPTEDVSKYEPEEMSLAVESGKKTLGLVPRVSVFVKNGEYQYNIDFGTTCTRREPLEAAVRIMIDMGKANNLGLSQINNIKDILGKHGFTKPCVLCFVEGKRTYELISANRLSRQWNVVLKSLGIQDAKVIGTERPISDDLLQRLKEMADGSGYEKYVDKQYRDKSEKDPVGLTKSRAKTIANIMLSEYERTGKSTLINRMRPDMLMNSRGTDYLFRKYIADAPTLKGLIAARDGAGTPKPHTSYPVYDTASWKEIFDLKKDVKKEVKHLYDIGGVRLQSFSDFNEYMVVDYLQAMLDLSARRLPAHAYTKVTSFVELFGEMLNINMSLIGNTSRDIPVEYDGLKPAGKGDRVVLEDENGKWTYNWATESFDPNKAFELRREVRFNGKVGTVGIGISDKMIEAMLNDPEIDMIIPFHKSGIQDHVLISAGFKRADGTSVKDYSDYQNTKRPKGADDYLFNEHMQELKDAKKVAKDYLKWCKEHKYTPKFEQFSKHENYFKLLEDFRSYDNDGKPVVQKAVEFKLADNFNDILKDAIRNRDEVVSAISNIQNNKALMGDLEEAVRYAHLDGEVKKVMLDKVAKAIGGKENLKVLSQEDMFDELAKTDPKKAQEFRDGKGVLYGFAKEGKIYLNVQGFNAHTPVHEYAHLWANVVQKTNKELWNHGVSLLEKSDKWKELASQEQYKELLKDKDRFASEVFAQIVGENNEEIARYFQNPDSPEYKNKSLKSKILQFIKDVFGHIRSMFDPKFDPSDVQSAKDFATMSLLDLYDENRSDALAQKIKEIRKKGEFLASAEQQAKPMYQEQSGTPKGAYYNNTTYLFENADQSTFVHEMSHAYMDALQRLADNGNAQAQRDIDVIRKWLGKKQGQEFTQADWERFARGFEMYLREGKAPNEYLGGVGGVFDSFKNWLMNIYSGIKSLMVTNEKGEQEPVKINQDIKNFYDEMLGGEDIDNVIKTAQEGGQELQTLQNKMQELADMAQVLAEERSKLVRDMANNVKPDTTWANVKDWGNNLWESARDLPINVLQSSYARLAAIDKKLGLLVQRAEQSQGLRIKRWTDQIKPFYEAFNDLSAEDKAKVQFYLLNQQWGEVEGLLGQENTDAVHNMLKTIYDELIASGVEVGYRENYFPRSVLDYDGLLQEMGLTYPALRKEMEQAIGKDASPEEQAEWLDKHIMGFNGNVSTKGNKYTKERKLDLITDKMAQYYKPSMETLVNYVEGMAKLLSMREAFGKDIEYKGSEESAKDSIGKIIDRMFGDNKLTKKEIDEVRDVLSALYLPNGIGNKFLQAMRQYGYATKLSYSTTIRQFADIGMMMKVNGVLNTLDALFHPDKRITLENLGIDPLGEEFQTSKKDIGGKIANFSTKWKGINWADAIMKNAFMRGNYKDLQKLAKTPDKFHEKYDALFGDETDTLIKDLNDDKVSEPVKVLLFHEISKIQPISRSAMPTAYLSNPNGRVFYMFKTFSLHRAEYMVSELANDFRTGDLKKAGKDIMADVAVIGWEGLVELLISFLKYGWQAFVAAEVLDTFAGAGLGVLGLNKHQALQITRGQVGDFFQEMVGVGTPLDDIGYMIRHADDTDKLLRAFLPDMIIEPLLAGPKPISNKKKKTK